MPSAALTPDNDYRFPPAPLRAQLFRADWDAVMGSIGLRLRVLEAVNTGIAQIQAELQQFGLQRLDEAILPLILQTELQIAALQAEVTATQEANAAIIDDMQEEIAAQLAALAANIAATAADLQDVQDQIDIILADGIPAGNVAESATRVFVTPAQKAEIGSLRSDLAAAQAAIAAVSYSATRPFVWTTGNVSVGAGQRVWFNTASAAGQATLSSSPSSGDTIDIGRIGANPVTINRNGKTIAGLAENLVIDNDMTGVTLTYVNGGWRVRPWSIA